MLLAILYAFVGAALAYAMAVITGIPIPTVFAFGFGTGILGGWLVRGSH
jgi:hypothetical protein